MSTRVKLDKQALREFVTLMDETAEVMSQIQDAATPRYARAGGDAASAYRGGVKVTLGSVDFDHPGRRAGELVADRIADTLNFVRSLEEGARCLGDTVRGVLDEMGAQDSIAAADLARINASVHSSCDKPFGVVDNPWQ
ncbi:MAG TPA: hypothetical protein VE172_01815 [Stackebrandtia sp.]|uniref:hypothetical protein n=1 Tax=Stackebrandtia sp. TaxID=2023065 RepID=UPI002D28E641|nr:hypothetical protein [Stackebrandtia sp.]HZE37522.1 hypothetical protein [Stackebrandtia sp.]